MNGINRPDTDVNPITNALFGKLMEEEKSVIKEEKLAEEKLVTEDNSSTVEKSMVKEEKISE